MITLGQSRGRRSKTAIRLMLGCGLIFASPVAAQSTRLTLGGNIITFPAPTAADYVAGFVNSATGVTFTVDATSSSGQANTTTIAIKSTSANLGNGKILADLQWRRSDLATWNSITLANVNVEARLQMFNGANDPWSNTIFFRMKLAWATDAPAVYTANYTITLTVSQ